MGKFIKVTQTNGKRIMIPIHEIELIYPDEINGAIVYRKGKKEVLTKESLEQIEAKLLRDGLAKHAMQAIVSSIIEMADRTYYQVESSDQVAKHAYETADAMLKERTK